ncbi:uncharacterized protein BDR25DRAFT_299124 [Lindgomyces ingoldianus]|uniref:Uncharacterized protein n=1 Tax=Lindgomyces ingoldianus TaxID=673940 RepID=A0ACB6Q706_9PLEO|nr:uncharacterized protein BDR25DRAFT_299124 [Lindgomyces ingoldianus]KAF2462658.1 hypothetical protein BDR25DRAFT_299124 [Lindgomyces ingoldianus]
MEHDDAPNFSYAFGNTSTFASASWNPALRPDSEDVRPVAPIAKHSESSQEETMHVQITTESRGAQDDDLSTASALSPRTQNIFPDKEPTSEDNFLDRYGGEHASKTLPPPPEQVNGHGNGVVYEAPIGAEQGLDLGEQITHGMNGSLGSAIDWAQLDLHEESALEDSKLPEEHAPAENYEAQRKITLLEEAVTESAQSSVVADHEPATDDWGASDEVFDLGGKLQEAPLPLPTPPAEAVGTAVGDQLIGNSSISGTTGHEIDWGNGDNHDLFGSGDGQLIESRQLLEATPGAHVMQDSGAKPAPTGDMWDLALDDDFLPDNDGVAAPFELDDEGFLEDEPSQPAQHHTQPAEGSSTTSRYAPQIAQPPAPAPNAFGPQGPQFTDFSQLDAKKPMTTPNVRYGGYTQPSPYQQQAERPAIPSSAQSFADKAKGGYHSPFDLPEDIVSNRKRPTVHHHTTPPVLPTPPPPPPRSSSMYSNTSVPGQRPPPPSSMSVSSLSPPSSSHSMKSPLSGMPSSTKPAAPSKTASSDFFAELPVASKPKPSGRYTPQQHHPSPQSHHAPPQLPPKERTSSWSSLRNEVLPDATNLIPQFQPPERLPAFPDFPSAPARSNSLPVPQPGTAPAPSPSRYSPAPPPAASTVNARYSPAPPAAPAASARYSPAPPPQGPAHNRFVSEPMNGLPKPPPQPYAPRTSSPLAQHTAQQDPAATPQTVPDQSTHQGHHVMYSVDSVPRIPMRRPLEEVSEIEEQEQEQDARHISGRPVPARSETPPPSGLSSTVGSPRKRSNYTPQYQPGPPPSATHVAPPRRSLSQSPGATMKSPLRALSSVERPASSHGIMSPASNYGIPSAIPNVVQSTVNVIPHKRHVSHDFEYIPPTDERVADPLSRWKGYPIFTWGLGGTVVTSLPKQIPRYGGGSSMPMMKCSPGEVKIQNMRDILPMPEDIAKFPGPLKSKNKKKDASAWLGRKIEVLESQLKAPGIDQSMNVDDIKRLEEKALLWKIMQVLVDNDGHLEGNATVEAAVRKVLSYDDLDSNDSTNSLSTGADLVGVSRSNTVPVQADPIDPKVVQELRTLLTKGDREKAVWHAVDQRLWAHAMLLSSTLNKDIWKQVVQEFVRKEVKKMGGNNQALAVLYEIFAGNWEDCVDELVPASARAGFQMLSTDGAGSTQNALQGLEKWRETLSLILNNRSEGDVQALLSLGKLLAGYRRVEAAHICFLFARSAAYVGGVDDTQSDIVLVGTDHRLNPLELGNDLEPVLLTEVYEFALSLSAPSGSHVIPHLQNYKLAHAYLLAEYGQKTDAQTYCDAIAVAMKSTTRVSPYYHGAFIASLDDLSKRLSQSPKDGSSSWISKPSMDKVSNTLLSKFNSFITGDDDDTASNHSAGNEVGPFAKIAGNTPSISPSQSGSDLYGTYFGGGVAPASLPSNSRYAPSNAYAPRGSLDQGTSRYEPPGRTSMESADGGLAMRQPSSNYLPSPQLSGPYTPSQPPYSPPSTRTQAPKTQSYSPLKADAPTPTYGSPYQSIPTEEPSPSFGGYQPLSTFDDTPPSEPAQTSDGYEPPSISYEPPTSSYEPPTYQPYSPDDGDASPVEKPKKNKSIMDDDDDDDITTRAAALKGNKKSEADRKADEAFRKAAEADAARDKDTRKSSGWFGGWFKKDPNAAPGPIKAKLGEENNFYYDPELKKWVNKKAGAQEASKPIATLPPPKSGPPSRSVSGNSVSANHALGGMGPPLGSSLPHALSAPTSRPPTSNPQRSSSMPPPMSGPGSRASTPGIPSDSEGSKLPTLMPPTLGSSGPPSRPSTGMSNASSIEDLIGAPAARKGGAKKGKRGGRYVDVMAKP